MMRPYTLAVSGQVIAAFGGALEKNCSHAGSDITVNWGMAASFLTRIQDGQLGEPDVILILGGLNDFWLHDQYRGSFSSGVIKFFTKLDALHPNAEKIIVLNRIHQHKDYEWGLSPFHRKALREAAQQRGYRIVDLENAGLVASDFDTAETPHPTASGMKKIADCVIASLRAESKATRLLDCLELDDKGYLLTDCIPNLRTTEIEVKLRPSLDDDAVTNVIYSTSGYTILGADQTKMLALMWRKGALRYDNSPDGGLTNCGPKFGLAPEESDAVVETMTKGNGFTLDGFSIAGVNEATDVAASGSLVIGATRASGSNTFSGTGRKIIYRIVVRESGEIVHDYVPALDLMGRATLYDKVDDCCLGVYGQGVFAAYDFDGVFVNYSQYRGYASLEEAYGAALPGEVVVVTRAPDESLTVEGRVNVSIDTRGFPNVGMTSPSRSYLVSKEGGVLSLIRNDGMAPRFACSSASDLFKPVDGKLKLHIANVLAGCYYAVYTAENLDGPWTLVGKRFELERADYEIPAPTSQQFFIKAVMKESLE